MSNSPCPGSSVECSDREWRRGIDRVLCAAELDSSCGLQQSSASPPADVRNTKIVRRTTTQFLAN